jgi:hypothetical protein
VEWFGLPDADLSNSPELAQQAADIWGAWLKYSELHSHHSLPFTKGSAIMNPDAIIKVRFKTTDEGGRKTNLVGSFYSCPLFIDGEGFDCRVFLENQEIELGKWYSLPVKFLNLSFVASKLAPGKPIILWEGKDVAQGEVLEILPSVGNSK